MLYKKRQILATMGDWTPTYGNFSRDDDDDDDDDDQP